MKILIAGGFGVGKTTLVGAVSEVAPLRTEEYLTQASVGVDDLDGRRAARPPPPSRWTSAASPSAANWCCTCSARPGRNASGSCGTTWSTARWARSSWSTPAGWTSSFASIDFFESRGIPFVVGVNCFHGVRDRTQEEIRRALDLDPQVPLVLCDARDRTAGRDVLLALIDHLMAAQSRTAPHPVT